MGGMLGVGPVMAPILPFVTAPVMHHSAENSTGSVRPYSTIRKTTVRMTPMNSLPTRSVYGSTFRHPTQVDLATSAATPSGHSIHPALSQTPPNPAPTPEYDEASALGGGGTPSKCPRAPRPVPSPQSNFNPHLAQPSPNPPCPGRLN
ncbi:hypothetical protein NMY22_g16595 [Coprinellus aureogranulatus]|nr:hypothetical protein NMY22_g16595 [Coprinellus aureogranulatus]